MANPPEKEDKPSAEKILNAATELFAQRGFAAVSVRDITEQAGVNKALLFYYFDTKAGLLQRVLERYYQAHASALAPSDCRGSTRERMHALVTSYLDFMEDHRPYLQIVQHELLSNADNLTMLRSGMQMLFDRVEELLGPITCDGHLHVRQFYISFAGLVTTYFNYAPVLDTIWQGDPLSAANRRERRQHLHWMVDRILDGLQSSPTSDDFIPLPST